MEDSNGIKRVCGVIHQKATACLSTLIVWQRFDAKQALEPIKAQQLPWRRFVSDICRAVIGLNCPFSNQSFVQQRLKLERAVTWWRFTWVPVTNHFDWVVKLLKRSLYIMHTMFCIIPHTYLLCLSTAHTQWVVVRVFKFIHHFFLCTFGCFY
jgi:hypothetical protein